LAFLRLFSWSASRPFTRAPIRILAATHRNLEALVKAGQFREDLYYRLNVVTAVLPSLRERREDLPLLMDHFLRLFAEKNRKAIRGFTQEARELLLRYDYPGNVRELENIVERAVVLTRDDAIGRSDLPLSTRTLEETESAEKSMPAAVKGVERRMIREALVRSGGVQTRAAEMLGISERALRYKLKKYGLSSEDSR
jgi:DNA-binding NtrC family response regulator